MDMLWYICADFARNSAILAFTFSEMPYVIRDSELRSVFGPKQNPTIVLCLQSRSFKSRVRLRDSVSLTALRVCMSMRFGAIQGIGKTKERIRVLEVTTPIVRFPEDNGSPA
jgi:hypothetical protein